MKFFKKNLKQGVSMFVLAFLFTCSFAFAGNDVAKIQNPIAGTDTIQSFLGRIVPEVIKLGIPIVALAIIYSGFLFVKAQGNSEEITKAKDTLLYSLIGAAILLGAWAIAGAVFDTVKLFTK